MATATYELAILTKVTARSLPVNTVVEVTWSGGNGPHRYIVTSHALDGTARLATKAEWFRNELGMNWLELRYLGPCPMTEARIVDWFKAED